MDALFLLFIFLAIITVVGHLIWVAIRAVVRFVLLPEVEVKTPSPIPHTSILDHKLRDLATTERVVTQFFSDGKLGDEIYQELMKQIQAERANLVRPRSAAPKKEPVPPSKPIVTPPPPPPPREAPPSVVTPPPAATDDEVVIKPVPSFINDEEREPVYERIPPPPPPPPRRPFSEVLNSFMEESNIRWGEIIGGLLIIGCSTALVVSLWAQISQIPVLKFLIFTTVTAVLFGIGLYTEHRWKLPTTSRGILTIATLLVPLNFLAIAAVSASNTSGALVLGSELVAPAIFLCLVYFAGRVITPGCAHILSAGVLGSSVGQLLVRHFASLDGPPALLIFLGAFPVLCYVVTVGLAMRFVLEDREISANETSTVFTVLGAMSFAALLPFGLLLYKSGPLGMSMMYLAPIVTLWGLPLVATGAVLWKRIANKELVASRTTGTALGILGLMIVLAGMVLAWPNPSSIVPAALLNFAIFTVLAVALEIPIAHLIAAMCFALAYLVTFHVFAGSMTWVNLRVMSLLNTSLSISTGQALVGAFALFVAASEWLSRRKRERDSFYYLVSACLIAVLSLAFTTYFGIWSVEYHALWIVYGLYAVGAFWIAWRRKLAPFTLVGSALLLFSLAHGLGQSLAFSFPWQTALFAHATICALAAILLSRYKGDPALSRSVLTPLNYSALISIVLGVVSLFQANQWEVTWMQAQRVFWIAGILLLLLWLNRRRLLFNAFQIALVCALVLTIKAWLQQYDWYLYLPLAFMHPAALQIQGIVLAFFCLALLALRFLAKRASTTHGGPESWQSAAARLLDTPYSVDRILVWLLPIAFLLFAVYGAFSGMVQELAGAPTAPPAFNIAGFPHQEAFAFGSWILLGLLTLIMIASFWDRRKRIYLLGALVTLAAVIPLLAGRFETQIATATAWRWLAAIFLIAGSLLLWFRKPVAKLLSSFGWPSLGPNADRFVSEARLVLIILTFLPLLVLTICPVLVALSEVFLGDLPTGTFSSLESGFSDGIPLVLVALVMIGYALRERMPEFTFYAGMLFSLAITLAFLLAVVTGGGPFNEVVLVRLLQLNALTIAVYSLPWLSTRGRWQSALNESDQRFANFLFKLQLGIAIVLNVVLFLPILVELILEPGVVSPARLAAGSLLGWLAFVITVVAVAWLSAGRGSKLSANVLAILLFAINCLIAFTVSGPIGWVGVHMLTVCVTLTAWVMLAAAELTSDTTLPFPLNSLPRTFDLGGKWQSRCRELAAITGTLAVFLSLRSLADRESSHWWSIGPLLAITALAAALNWKTMRRGYIYAAGILVNLAVSLWWIFIRKGDWLGEFVWLNLIAAALTGILWLWLELRARQRSENVPDTMFSFHNLIATQSLGLLAMIIFFSFVTPTQSLFQRSPALSWFAFFSILVFIAACLWDKHAKYAVAGLYTLGIIACGIVLHLLELPSPRQTWSIAIFLALYSLAVALLWRSRERIIVFAEQFGIPRRISSETRELSWLSAMTILAVATFGYLAFWINLEFPDLGMRVSVSLALAAQFLTFGLLAEGIQEQRWRRAAVAVLVIGAVLLGWSWLTPGVDATWLNRSVILMIEAFGLTAIYGLLLDKATARFPQWTNSARACVPWLLGAGVIALFFCLGTEIFYQLNFGMVNIHPVALVAIGLTLVAAVVTCVLFALSPKHDPLNLSERGRTRYVYVAEVMLALLFLHVRLTMPWLFLGFIERYWPLVVMAIAYFGVVASEALRRHKLFVLAHPLERTGAFLPLLPVLGFWVASSEVDFSLVLFVIGGLYGLLSILRRSFAFGMLAALAGNAGLWYMWNRTEHYQFLQHPQLWLIPVALSVLIAAYLNEDRMTEDQMTGIRYLSLVTIYVSSTADIFINGVANSPWLPLILGSFSLAGVFAGISFRIRGLLLLGSIFLLLSIVTMIWYASANFGWTWLWYVAGIVTGATIIFMFAVFEKKRGEVLRVVEGLKEWDR